MTESEIYENLDKQLEPFIGEPVTDRTIAAIRAVLNAALNGFLGRAEIREMPKFIVSFEGNTITIKPVPEC